MSQLKRPDLLFSLDVEADGPIPGPYSMVSIGVCVIGRHDGLVFTPQDVELDTFYAELRPISEQFDPEALAVSGLTRQHLLDNGRDPAEAMRALRTWIEGLASDDHVPVLAAYPLGYDFMFATHYLVSFAGGSPFGHGRGLDMKSYFAGMYGTTTSGASKRRWPKSFRTTRRHTHNALDDAMGQGEQAQKMLAAAQRLRADR